MDEHETPLITDILKCERCGKDHYVLEFKKLTNSDKYSYWGMCPNLNEPIIRNFVRIFKKGQ